MRFITTRELFIQAAKEFAAEIKAEIKIVKHQPLVMQIASKDGIVLFTHGAKPNFNTNTTSKLAKDKDLTVRVLEELGIGTPRSHFVWLIRRFFGRGDMVFESASYKRLLAFAHKVGFPIFFKLNDGSQGKHVYPVRDEESLRHIVSHLLKKAPGKFIAQEACMGEEYRICVVQGEIILAYGRSPMSVTGDGASTIQELVALKKIDLQKRGRNIELLPDSEKIIAHLEPMGLTLDSVLPAGQEVTVLSNRNLSDGSEPYECTEAIRAKYAKLCRDIYERGGVEYCGLDLMEDTRSGEIKPMIIEINSSPGYKHFIRSAPENAAKVRHVFKEAIRAAYTKQLLAHRPTVVFVTHPNPSPVPIQQG